MTNQDDTKICTFTHRYDGLCDNSNNMNNTANNSEEAILRQKSWKAESQK